MGLEDIKKNNERRCIILGGCGFLGSVVAKRLVSKGWNVRIFDKEDADTSRLRSVMSSIELIRGDLMNVDDLVCALDGIPIVLHFVGTSIPQTSMENIQFDIKTNVLPTVQLLELMRKNGAQRLLFSSSGGTVYGVAKKCVPIPETHTTCPIVAYGISKLMIEKFIHLFSFNYNFPAVILRFANPYGESQQVISPQGAVSAFIKSIRQGKPIHIWGDGSNVRDYLYEEDLATAVESVLNKPELTGTFNVGTGKGTSLNELVALITKIFGRSSRVIQESARSFDVPYNVLDIDHIRRTTDWQPSYTLEQGIRKMECLLKNQ